MKSVKVSLRIFLPKVIPFYIKKEIGVSVNEFRFAFHVIWVMG